MVLPGVMRLVAGRAITVTDRCMRADRAGGSGANIIVTLSANEREGISHEMFLR
jgi:hypothetical protein